MRIGICERGWSRTGASSQQAIDELFHTAAEVEQLGFDKLWLTEHHSREYAWALPDVLVAAVGRATRRLTVGIGGVLASSRNPYRTALDLSLLNAALPGRFDAGIGRAPAGMNHRCLSGDAELPMTPAVAMRYLQRVATLLGCLGFAVDGSENTSAHHDEFALVPTASDVAAPWLLGSSVASMMVAARWGLPFGCIDSPIAPAVVARYRSEFRPSRWLAEPRVLVSIIAVSGDNEEDALAGAAVHSAEGGLELRDLLLKRADVGARFARVIDSFSPDEIVYTDCSADPGHRAATYRAIAEQVIAAAPRVDDTPPSLHISA
ncbi:MAG: luciferase family oxidoreductase, group 1 [bacterium]|nr:luciferase family oxidoreductase, group 1 [bacterium]